MMFPTADQSILTLARGRLCALSHRPPRTVFPARYARWPTHRAVRGRGRDRSRHARFRLDPTPEQNVESP